MAWKKGNGKPPGSGRKKGSLNKSTIEIRVFAKSILEDKDYQERLRTRITAGRAPKIEELLYHYAYGKPPDKLHLGADEDTPLTFTMKIDHVGGNGAKPSHA